MNHRHGARCRGGLARAVLLAGLAGPAAAQQPPAPEPPPASVVGRVIAADGGEPIRFSLVYLVRADAAVRIGATLTDADGAFLFRDVSPGTYHLRVDRLGYEPEPGRPIVLASGERYTALLASAPRAVAIAPIVVSGEACYGAEELREVPELAKLWREAVKAAEARRLFDRRYRYTATLRQVVWTPARFAGPVRRATQRTVTNDPARAVRLEEHGADPGYGWDLPGRIRLTAPELPELFGPSFLRTHCLVVEADRKRERRIGFRPLIADSGRVDISGTIVLDSAVAVDRLELRYLRGVVVIAEGELRYGQVPVLGGALRFARRLDVHGLRPGGRRSWEGRARVEDYRDFAADTAR